jgi:hypothetical protein
MARHDPDDEEEERPRWRDADEDDEPRDWEVEPEEEKEDKQPVLGGTEPVGRFLFLVILGCILLGGVIAFILAVADWVRR